MTKLWESLANLCIHTNNTKCIPQEWKLSIPVIVSLFNTGNQVDLRIYRQISLIFQAKIIQSSSPRN